MTEDGPYTTITVKEYTHMANVILWMREKLQKVREYAEAGAWDKATELLTANEEEGGLK